MLASNSDDVRHLLLVEFKAGQSKWIFSTIFCILTAESQPHLITPEVSGGAAVIPKTWPSKCDKHTINNRQTTSGGYVKKFQPYHLFSCHKERGLISLSIVAMTFTISVPSFCACKLKTILAEALEHFQGTQRSSGEKPETEMPIISVPYSF